MPPREPRLLEVIYFTAADEFTAVFDAPLFRHSLDQPSAHVGPALLYPQAARSTERFLRGDDADADSLYREALELGLDESDLVVRRRLIQRMRLGLESQVRAEPEAEALRAYRSRHPERFSTPPQVRLSQVFFDPENGTGNFLGKKDRQQGPAH